MTVSTPFAATVRRILADIGDLLIAKNEAYGDSALNPVRIFSTTDPLEQLRVRIDDKLSRIARGKDAGEDVITDLIGYLVLYKHALTTQAPTAYSFLPDPIQTIHDTRLKENE